MSPRTSDAKFGPWISLQSIDAGSSVLPTDCAVAITAAVIEAVLAGLGHGVSYFLW